MFQLKQTDVTLDNKPFFENVFNNLFSATTVSLPQFTICHAMSDYVLQHDAYCVTNCKLWDIRDFQNVVSLMGIETVRAVQKRRYQKENPSYVISGCLSFRCKTNVMGLLYFFETTMELHGENSQEHVNTCLSTCRAFTESKLGQKGSIKQIWKVRYSLKYSYSKILFLLLFLLFALLCLGKIFNVLLTYLH